MASSDLGDSKDDLFESSKCWLLKAVTFDSENKLIPAFSCYKEGLDKLLEFFKTLPEAEAAKREAIRGKLKDYLSRAEDIKKRLLASGQIGPQGSEPRHIQYRISDGETGYGFSRIFHDCLKDGSVVWIRVEDPYIRKMYQIQFFVQFCELCTVRCPACLQEIHLITGRDDSEPQKQLAWLRSLGDSLQGERSVRLRLEFRETLHDREIFFSNGWRVKIGRGLGGIYQKTLHQPGLGQHELDLRRCHETTVDAFHESILR